MDTDNHYPGINNYAVKLIKYKARQLLGVYGFTADDREDLEQEMILDLLRRIPNFKSERAKISTFIARVVNNKIASIIEARKTGMRDYRCCNCSLNDRLEDKEGGSIERMDTITEDDYFQLTGRQSRPASELHDLSLDVHLIMKQLPPELAEFCRHLKNNTITEISKETGIPRSTLYDRLDKLRKIFKDAGLRHYH